MCIRWCVDITVQYMKPRVCVCVCVCVCMYLNFID